MVKKRYKFKLFSVQFIREVNKTPSKMLFLTALALLIAGTSALPNRILTERNIITDRIIDAIEEVSENIRDAGFDPLDIERGNASYALPVPVIFNTAAYWENVLSIGASDIVINDIHYDVVGFRLTFALELPHFHLSAGAAGGEVVVFDNKLTAEGSGRIDVRSIRVRGVLRISILGGIAARALSIDFNLGDVQSDINLNIQGYDISLLLNYFLNETVPSTLESFKREVDELLEIWLLDYINEKIIPEL